MYKVEWSKKAEADLAKIDRVKAKKIKNKVEIHLTTDPYNQGKPLVGNLKGQWSYRFSEYRVIYEIKQTKLLIIVVETGHRKEIYQ